MTNNEIINALNTINEIGTYKLTKKLTWAIMRNKEKLDKVYAIYDKERIKIVEEYCEVDMYGNPKLDEYNKIIYKGEDNDSEKKYRDDMAELLSMDNPDINALKVPFDCFYSDDPRIEILATEQILNLQFMISDEEE